MSSDQAPTPDMLPSDDNLSTESRKPMLAQLRTCTLKHDELGQEILLNMLLRNLLHHNLIDQADKLICNTELHEPYRSTNQAARFCFYKGYVKAVQLDYTEANNLLQQALRKAPEKAMGFRTIATKLWLIVQLLMGEIPARSEFLAKGLKNALAPYLLLTSAARFGQLNRFTKVVQKNADLFHDDRTYMLIQRIRHNVIKTGLRRISLSYSRISFTDICQKLNLDNPEDTEYIAAKAISDRVIDAQIDHKTGVISSKEVGDIYSTSEPVAAFHKRIAFCLRVHNDAVQAMRYPYFEHQEEDPEAKKKREMEEEEELSTALDDCY
ncbi:26S proteasome non-ATPase regulatory subunit 3 [Diplonema papillatum]|nr:26S proteasome non-ATPase regulatory subunit 3 [Diplonema papillatum]